MLPQLRLPVHGLRHHVGRVGDRTVSALRAFRWIVSLRPRLHHPSFSGFHSRPCWRANRSRAS